METLESLKYQIKTTQDLHSVVKTMKTLSAVNIRHYERVVDVLNQYSQVLEMGLQILLRDTTTLTPLSRLKKQSQSRGFVIFGSDQGLCGAFNQRVIQLTVSTLSDPQFLHYNIIVVGQRAADQLEILGFQPEVCFSIPRSLSGVTPLIQDLLLAIDTWHHDSEADSLGIFYNQPQSSTSYHPVIETMLPLDQQWLQQLRNRPWPTHQLPTYRMERQHLMKGLIQQYLFLSLYRACVGSLASENAARLVTMQNAEHTIEDKITSLTSTYHQHRQTQVTEELLDIVSGFEALTSAHQTHEDPDP